MGKGKKHNKLYITQSEHVNEFGGKSERESSNKQRRLPFYCCALTLQPFENPVCTPDGVIYELLAIVPFLKKYHVDPITGNPLSSKDLIKLHFHKNTEGKYHCPVTHKEFTDYTHIVAIKTSGNVYSMDAIKELNIQFKNYNDLLTGEPFVKKDIIHIQDPLNPTIRDFGSFYHVKMGLDLEEEKKETIRASPATEAIFKEMESAGLKANAPNTVAQERGNQDKQPKKEKKQPVPGFVSNAMFTSAGFSAKPVTDLPVGMRPGLKTNKKGYVRLNTNLGQINLELQCDKAPKACENFITHCKSGYYDGVLFHRSIRNFMIQGGDPTGTGRGGESIWGEPFLDEFSATLMHDRRGVVSMANKGPNTNTSQFFITFARNPHLNDKHTVFGRVVGGMDVLDKMEKVPTDSTERPVSDIKIESTTVFVNPFETLEEEKIEEQQLAEKRRREKELEDNPEMGQWFSNPTGRNIEDSSNAPVGKYLAQPAQSSTKKRAIDFSQTQNNTASTGKKKNSSFDDRFGKW